MESRGTRQHVWLRRLFPTATFIGCSDASVSVVTCDSRVVQPGHAFVAVRGSKHNGRQYVDAAIRAGATVVISDEAVDGLEVPQCVVPDPRQAYAVLCHAVEGYPARQLRVIGVTGTNGKTTTTMLVRSILSVSGLRTGLLGTVEQFDGTTTTPSDMTTPDPDSLAATMARMARNGCTHVVMEVSSHALDQHRTDGIRYDAAVFTNLTHDHLDYHRTREAYAAAKGRLFEGLSPDAGAILNADDPASTNYAAHTPARKLWYGVKNAAELAAADVRLSLDGTRFRVRSAELNLDVCSRLIGLHNVYNCVAATGVALHYGISPVLIRRGIEQLKRVPGRLEPVECGQPFHVLVDYAHTPDAIAAVLGSLRRIVLGRLICVFGAGGDRDTTKRPAMGRAAEQHADIVIVTSDNPRGEAPEAIIRDIMAGLERPAAVRVEIDRRRAIETALSTAKANDCVLIAGKGHEDYQIIGQARLPFDDRAVAAAWLNRHGAGTEKRQMDQRGRRAAG